MARSVSCAAPGWSCSHTTGTGIPGARLSVVRIMGGEQRRHGDHHGRMFPSSDAASAFMLERGYTIPYRDAARSTFKRAHRVALRRIMARARADLATMAVPTDAVFIANRVRAEVQALGCDVLLPLAWTNAVYTLARRLRPEEMRAAA